jgi:predicted DsbA family dithiol-disulfide isomerase
VVPVLRVGGRAGGLAAAPPRRVLVDRTFREQVDADWERARKLGVTGVPTFVSNGYGVVGAQPYEVLAEMVAEAVGEPRTA